MTLHISTCMSQRPRWSRCYSMQQEARCDLCRQHTFSLRWALRETDTAASRVPPGADGPDDVVLLHNDSDNFVLSSGAAHLCMGLNRFVLVPVAR
jgi:hypothetical protein